MRQSLNWSSTGKECGYVPSGTGQAVEKHFDHNDPGCISCSAGRDIFNWGSIVVHWGENGMSDNSAGKWILWAMLVLAALSLFTHSSFLKRGSGFQAQIGREMACAMSAGMVSMFSLIDITLVVYDFYSFAIVPVIGTAAIVSVFIIYALTAYFREHHGPEAREKK